VIDDATDRLVMYVSAHLHTGMFMVVIRTDRLTRRFGDLVAVDDLSVEVPRGGVTGLVGPNGSGKSTLIRMLLGLIRPSSGTADVLGHPISRPEAYASQVGALVEAPAFVPGLSARANLRSLARLRGLPDVRVEDVLGIVGLMGREQEPVKRFSLGMKQRLGIAAALLPDPQVLVLDEPTNGLDPAGIVEIRGLLQRLGESGRSVIVSSHLLTEIQSVCDHLLVLRFGVLMYAGPMADLLQRAESHIDVQPEFDSDLERLHQVLVDAGWTVTTDSTGQLRVLAPLAAAAQVNRDAGSGRVTLRAIHASQDDLERIFLQMTGTNDDELAASRADALHPPHDPGASSNEADR
jgi:ABC-2 type transport system ATP-binding protein